MSFIRRFTRCAALSLGALGATAAHAGYIEFSTSFTLDNLTAEAQRNTTPGNQALSGSAEASSTVELGRFDASLGTLTGVTLSFISDFSHSASGWSYDGAPQAHATSQMVPYPCGNPQNPRTCYQPVFTFSNDTWMSGSASAALSIELLGFPGASLSTGASHAIACSQSLSGQNAANCQYDVNGSPVAFGGAFDSSSLALSAFAGADPLQFGLRNFTGFSASCDYESPDPVAAEYCGASSRVWWSGQILVGYSYDAREIAPVDTPEPGSLALLGAGLIGIGLARRRRAGSGRDGLR